MVNNIIFVISVMGNRGTFTKSLKNILLDFEFAYHMGYMIVCMLGLCLHEFFYSLLVGAWKAVSWPYILFPQYSGLDIST